MPAQKTYNMKFHCDNCGANFTKEIPKGQEVEEGRTGKCAFVNHQSVYCLNCGCLTVHKR